MKKTFKNTILVILLIATAFIYVPQAGQSYAITAGIVDAVLDESASSANQDQTVFVSYTIENGRGEAVTVKNMNLQIEGGGLTITQNDGTLNIPPNETSSVSFKVKVDKNADLGNRDMVFTAKLYKSDAEPLENQTDLFSRHSKFTILEKFATEIHEVGIVAAVNVTHAIKPSSGFVAGNNNKLTIMLHNFGNSVIKNGMVKLTLPEGLSIYNNSNQANIGYLGSGSKYTVEFPITVEKGTASKNYPIEVVVSGQDVMRSDVKANQKIYIPVNGSDKEDIKNDISIVNVSMPETALAKTVIPLGFSVKNSGSSSLRGIKITAEQSEGLLNKSRNIFIANFKPGETKNFSVNYYAPPIKEDKSYSVKITAQLADSTDKNPVTVSEYATVNVPSGEGSDDGTKKPQLMVDNYSYGGTAVQAGSKFILNLGIMNTSSKRLSNIKVSLTDEGGVFVPAGGSNSFFIDSIGGKAHYTKSVAFNVKPQAEQKTMAITVKMTYEAGDGDPLESSDIISVPVTQKTKLFVDEFIPPQEAYVGMPVSCELQFYNMGKTVLSNVKVNCDGNFDVAQSNSYYAGNVESGKSDTYSFSVIPKEEGKVTGTVSFTFEDVEGEAQLIEVPFEFEAMEQPPMDDGMGEEPKEEKKIPWSLIIAAIVLTILVATFVAFKKIRKKKLDKALELDDFDIDEGKDEKK